MKQILISLENYLLDLAVEGLLSQEEDLCVLNEKTQNDILSGENSSIRPNVVILDETTHFSDLQHMFNLLQECPDFRILVISLQENRLSMYDKHELLISNSHDLVSAVKKGLGAV